VLSVLTIRAEGAWTSSHALWQRALAVSPGDPKAIENYALVLQVTRQDQALAVIERGLDYAPLDPYLRLAQARLSPDAAFGATAIATLSGSANAFWWYGERLRAEGRVPESVYWLERAWRKQRSELVYIRAYAQVLVATGRLAEARPLLAVLFARTGAAIDRRAFLDVAAP
jgi:tetratricopeptide (TPR) repeat protein